MKRRLYTALVVLVALLSSLVLVLPGALRDNNVAQIDGVQHLTSFEGVGRGRLLFFDDFSNATNWKVSRGSVETSLVVQGTLNFSVVFDASSIPQAASISRSLNVSLDDGPVANLQVSLSNGVAYGIRLFGILPNGTTFSAWREGSSLQHRKGQATSETLSVNLPLESYLSTGTLPSHGTRITSILLYVEATSGTSGSFSLILTSLSIYSTVHVHVDSLRADGNYTSFVMSFSSSQSSEELFQVFVGFDITGSTDLQYTPFFLNGMTVLAQGATYHLTGASSYVLAVLRVTLATSLGSVPPPILLRQNSTSLAIVANQGTISHFKLDTIALRYSSQAPTFIGNVNATYSQYLFVYYIVFLFITPITATILLEKLFRSDNRS